VSVLAACYPCEDELSFVFQIQTGDPTGTGAGGESYWGVPFRDEHDLKGAAKHDSRGMVAMANKGAGTNG
jgi:peptidyl-prolyl cis-trans isomerase-like protein 2